ncbi:unnamed protein product [Camellia sinensis]
MIHISKSKSKSSQRFRSVIQKVFVHVPSEIAAHDVQKLLFCCLILLLSSVLFLTVTARSPIFKFGHAKLEETQQQQNLSDDSTAEPVPSSGLGMNLINDGDLKASYPVDTPAGASGSLTESAQVPRDIDLSPGQPLQSNQTSGSLGVIGRRSVSDLGTIGDNLGGSSTNSGGMHDQLYNFQMLEAAYYKLPQPKDSERAKSYNPGNSKRRAILLGVGALALSSCPASSLFAEEIPQNYEAFVNKSDGYSYYYPSDWREFDFRGHDSAFKDRYLQLQNVRVVSNLVRHVYSAPTQMVNVFDMQEKSRDCRYYLTDGFASTDVTEENKRWCTKHLYLGGYDMEAKAARAYDLAALKYWGPSTHINFPLENYQQELEHMKNMTRQEYVAHLRRKSSGFSRGASMYRGVTRHHQHGRWQARIGRVTRRVFLLVFTTSTPPPKLPPGKTGWPVIGETLDLLLICRKGYPEKFLHDRMERHCPDIFRTSLLGDSKKTFFCGPTAHKFLFANENKLVGAWWPKSFNKIFLSEGASALNSLATSTVCIRASRGIKESPELDFRVFEAGRDSEVDTGYGYCDSKQVAKFDNRFGNVIAGMMSVPIDFPGTSFNRAIKDSNLIRKELLTLIKERKMAVQQKNDDSIIIRDLLSHLLVTPDEDGKLMNDVEIADKIVGQLIAGYDTASTTITFILEYLAEYPYFYNEIFKEQMEIAKSKEPGQSLNWMDIQKMRYTWHVACEAMRLAPPAPLAFKEALTDVTFAGFTIPKGWKSVHSTHKNPAFFPNPEKFDPTRFEGDGPLPFTFVPFGGGPRMCPGKEYARLVILVFMHNLVTRFKWSKLIPNDKIIFKPVPFPEGGLPICLHPHKN